MFQQVLYALPFSDYTDGIRNVVHKPTNKKTGEEMVEFKEASYLLNLLTTGANTANISA